MGPFIDRQDNWKMIKYSTLADKLRTINGRKQPAYTLYLYGDLAYFTIYRRMRLYKNYLS